MDIRNWFGKTSRLCRIATALLACTAAAGLAGCVVVPIIGPDIPPIEGQVLRAGVPVMGAVVLASASDVPCDQGNKVTVTDAQGRFSIAGQPGLRGVQVAGPGVPAGMVCIDHAGRTWRYSYPVPTLLEGARSVRLVCDLDEKKEREAGAVCSMR
jgi:hypothetical protein